MLVPENLRDDELRLGDFEFDIAQESYLLGGATAVDDDCAELIRLIEQGRWDDAESVFETILGRLEDVHVSNRATRDRLDALSDEFYRALEFIETVEYTAIWIPSKDALLTAQEFEFVDRKVAEGIARQPEKLFSIDPRYFEELMASIYADLDYEVTLTKRTRDDGRDVIALSRKDYLSLKLLIECKRYARRRKVNVTQVRALFGVLEDEQATKALLATTSGFTSKAREFAERHVWKLELADHDDILRMIRAYGSKSKQ
jgi:HJR/Mrr/RecB family endonuclease